jgi:MFS family permease
MKPNPSLFTNLRSLPPVVWILFFGTFLNKFGSFVVPFLALYMTRRGYSIAQAGMAIGAYGAGNVVATMVGGHLADNIGRRKTIILSMLTGAASMLLLSQAVRFPYILVFSALAGLAGEFYRPASSALLTDLVPASNRVTAFSAYRMAINAGWAFGPATAGFIATRGYFWLFAGDAATSILFGAVAFFALPEGAHPRANGSASWGEATGTLLRDKKLHRFLLGAFGVALIFSQMNSTYGLAVMHVGFTPAAYGALLSMNGVLVVFCELPLTTVTRRFPVMRVVALGFLLAGIGLTLNAFATTFPALLACMVVFTFGEMTAMPVSSAYVAELAPAHMRGRYMGTYGLTWTLAQVVGPGMGMWLFSNYLTWYWITAAVIGVASAVIVLGPRARSSARAAPDNALGRTC